MTSLANYLYHAKMAEIHADANMSDRDRRTSGVREKMIDRYNKYSATSSSNNNPVESITPRLNSQSRRQ